LTEIHCKKKKYFRLYRLIFTFTVNNVHLPTYWSTNICFVPL